MTEFAAPLRAMLEEARDALNKGDAVQGERRAKAVSAIVKAERDVAEFLVEQRAAAWEDDDEACRAELRRRLARFAEAASESAPADVLARIAATGAAT
ncbi:MAG: hypothetical protein AB7H66_15105 [Hyphomonadaceae bacterium]